MNETRVVLELVVFGELVQVEFTCPERTATAEKQARKSEGVTKGFAQVIGVESGQKMCEGDIPPIARPEYVLSYEYHEVTRRAGCAQDAMVSESI